MFKAGNNSIVIVLLVLIIVIQAGSLFYRGTTAACAEAVSTADTIFHGANQAISTLQQDFESLSTNFTESRSEQILLSTLELQIRTIELISKQNSALLNVLAKCQ
ncbi:MAG: hypothetical protein ACRDFQ_07180 [Anaerolineales bacterium]